MKVEIKKTGSNLDIVVDEDTNMKPEDINSDFLESFVLATLNDDIDFVFEEGVETHPIYQLLDTLYKQSLPKTTFRERYDNLAIEAEEVHTELLELLGDDDDDDEGIEYEELF